MKNLHYPDNINFPENIKQWLGLLQTDISKQRYLLSHSAQALSKTFQQAVDLNALSIVIPEELGGANLDLTAQYYYHKNMAIASGALAFLCAQYIAGTFIIASGNNTLLKEQYLKQNYSGKYSFAISFSQLKHVTNPPVTAIETDNSYIVNGILTYVTGYKIFNTLVLAFVCGDKEIFAITPFCESESFSIIENLNLVTANSSNTVTCKLVNHVIDKSMVIIENNLGTFMNNNPKRLRNLVAFSAGLATAVLNLISENPNLKITQVADTYKQLTQDFLNIENALLQLPNTLS